MLHGTKTCCYFKCVQGSREPPRLEILLGYLQQEGKAGLLGKAWGDFFPDKPDPVPLDRFVYPKLEKAQKKNLSHVIFPSVHPCQLHQSSP